MLHIHQSCSLNEKSTKVRNGYPALAAVASYIHKFLLIIIAAAAASQYKERRCKSNNYDVILLVKFLCLVALEFINYGALPFARRGFEELTCL